MRVGIVGAGTMGAGIAQVALEAGEDVVLFDVVEGAVEHARERVGDGLARRAARLELDADSLDEWLESRLSRLSAAAELDELGEQCEVVIEAALEDLPLKRDVFAALDRAAGPDTILASNTSALSIAAIAARATDPGRILGLHFFNPAPLMRLVEVVVAARTRPAIAERGEALVRSWGKTPVRCADSPGFIVNRVNRPFTLEPLRILEAGQASIETVDQAIVSAGYPMGPFAYMDLVGLDVNLAAATALHAALGAPARLAPSPTQRRLVERGDLGRKTNRGFYVYGPDGHSTGPSDEFRRAPDPPAMAAEAIADRVVLAIANEAFFALGDRVAWPDEIDLAMRLGANHPRGPIEWARDRGLAPVLDALRSLRATEGDRFEPAPALEEAVEHSA